MKFAQRLASGLTLVVVMAVPGVAIPGVAGASASTAASHPAVTNCASLNDDVWEKPVAGLPTALKAGALSGLYYWHDVKGWHLRVTHESTSLQTFTGTVFIDTGKIHLDKLVNRSNVRVTLAASGKSLTYTIRNTGKVDGFDFRTKCARHMVTGVKVNGKNVNTRRIFVGAKAFHPNHNPFRFFAK